MAFLKFFFFLRLHMYWNGLKGKVIKLELIVFTHLRIFSLLKAQHSMSGKQIFFLFVILLPACKDHPPTSEPSAGDISKEEIMTFLKVYDDAWNTKKNKVVDSLYASQYKYFTSVGGVSSRARNLEILAADYYKLVSANRTEIDISIDGNTAIVSSRWQGTGMWKGEPFDDNQRCGLVIQKRGNELKLLSEHCVDISTEQSF